jgi:flagellar biosynthesis/type III secretory pathway protein FliH
VTILPEDLHVVPNPLKDKCHEERRRKTGHETPEQKTITQTSNDDGVEARKRDGREEGMDSELQSDEANYL